MARILLVDDDQDVHKSLGALLTLSGHVVLHAYNGLQGLEMADPAQPGQPDLIIADLTMPLMTGADMLVALRKSGNRVPIIMHFTGAEYQTVAENLRRAGAEEVVPKGRPEQLLQAIGRLLATLSVANGTLSFPPLPSVPPITAAPAPAKAAEKFTPATILVVDDDPGIHVRLSRWLTRDGYEVLSAYDGEEGLKAALEAQPNLVITDMAMPYLDGYELVTRLRAASFTAPIIAFFAGVTPEDLDVLSRTGATEIISKAEAPEVLLAAVARLLKIGD